MSIAKNRFFFQRSIVAVSLGFLTSISSLGTLMVFGFLVEDIFQEPRSNEELIERFILKGIIVAISILLGCGLMLSPLIEIFQSRSIRIIGVLLIIPAFAGFVYVAGLMLNQILFEEIDALLIILFGGVISAAIVSSIQMYFLFPRVVSLDKTTL